MPDEYDDLEQRLTDRIAMEVHEVRAPPDLAGAARVRSSHRRARAATTVGVLACLVLVVVVTTVVLSRRGGAPVTAPRPPHGTTAPAGDIGWRDGRCAVTRVRIVQGDDSWDILHGPEDQPTIRLSSRPATLRVTGPCSGDVQVFSDDPVTMRTRRERSGTLNGIPALAPGPLRLSVGTASLTLTYSSCASLRDTAQRAGCLGPEGVFPAAHVVVASSGADHCSGTAVALVQDGRTHLLYRHPGPVRPEIVPVIDLRASQPVRLVERGPCARQVPVRDPPGRIIPGPLASTYPLGPGSYRFARGTSPLSLVTPGTCAFATSDAVCEGGPGVTLRFRLRIR